MKYLILVFFLLCISGCTRTDINDYAVVLGMAIDLEDEIISVSFELLGDDSETRIITTQGETFSQCLVNLDKEQKTVPYLNHCSILIFGDEFARSGVENIYSFIMKDSDFRITNKIIVAENIRGKEILEHQRKKDSKISLYISDALDLIKNKVDSIDAINVFEFIDETLYSGSVLVPCCKIKNDEIIIEGGALFINYRLDCYFDVDYVNYIEMIRGKIKDGMISVNEKSFYLRDSKVGYHFNKNELLIDIRFEVMLISDSKKEVIINYFNQGIDEVFHLLKEKRAEPLGLKKMIYSLYPILYRKVMDEYEEYFYNLRVTTKIDVTIITPGIIRGDINE